jgi:two-component system, cell cycle sensor histidine kinase and response regulator CckA
VASHTVVQDPDRIAALRQTRLLGTPPQADFDRLTRLAAHALRAPVTMISFVDQAQQFVKSAVGLPDPWCSSRELPHTLCSHVVASGAPIVLEDVAAHPLYGTDETARRLGIRGYAGIPLVTAAGYALGALCAIDYEPRTWTHEELELLEDIAGAVVTKIELQTTAASAQEAADERQAILECALDCIVTMDLDGLVCEFNPAAERTFGYTREHAIGRSLGDLIVPPELRELHKRGLRRHIETGESSVLGNRMKLTAMRADGSTLPVELTIVRVEGDRPFFVGFIRDITDVVSAEAELRTAEARFRSLVEHLPLATYVASCDARPETMYVSPQMEGLLGYPSEDWLDGGSDFFERVVHPGDFDAACAERDRSRATGCAFHLEYRLIHSEGRTVWVLDDSSVIHDADGKPLFVQGFLLDITEPKQLEEQLRQSQKMDAIGQLAGGVAHDFNNMLTAITGYAELIGYSFEHGDARLDDLAELKRAAGHAAALTRQLLAFSRKQVLLPQRLDANETVLALESILSRTLGEQIELLTDLDPGLGTVEADPDQLAQVVLNIVLNARDAMPAGGRLTISTANVELDSGPHVAIAISDTGTGMDEETRTRVFEPFFTTKETGKGTGLGLATAYGVVSQSGGLIEIDSSPGAGSTFRVLLPRAVVGDPAVA